MPDASTAKYTSLYETIKQIKEVAQMGTKTMLSNPVSIRHAAIYGALETPPPRRNKRWWWGCCRRRDDA
jgi:hypothetical protein